MSLAPTALERALAYGSAALLGVVTIALARGHGDWSRVPAPVWLHIGTVAVCLALAPALLLGRRGSRGHRRLGYVWVVAMIATALLTFGIRSRGELGGIHILSAIVLTQAPMLVWHARRHRTRAHRYTVLSLVAGALLIAGTFTLLPGRVLGRWLFA